MDSAFNPTNVVNNPMLVLCPFTRDALIQHPVRTYRTRMLPATINEHHWVKCRTINNFIPGWSRFLENSHAPLIITKPTKPTSSPKRFWYPVSGVLKKHSYINTRIIAEIIAPKANSKGRRFVGLGGLLFLKHPLRLVSSEFGIYLAPVGVAWLAAFHWRLSGRHGRRRRALALGGIVAQTTE